MFGNFFRFFCSFLTLESREWNHNEIKSEKFTNLYTLNLFTDKKFHVDWMSSCRDKNFRKCIEIILVQICWNFYLKNFMLTG
jgi:hypothetical protein